MSNWVKIGATTIALVSISMIGFYCLCVKFVDSHELGYKFNARTGEVEVLKESGYIVALPLVVRIHTIDMRPMQVCINANSRVLNCKLVQFNKEGLLTFLAWHGRKDYEGPSASSNQSSTSDLSEILKSYAYEGTGKSYPFLTILRELKTDDQQVVKWKKSTSGAQAFSLYACHFSTFPASTTLNRRKLVSWEIG